MEKLKKTTSSTNIKIQNYKNSSWSVVMRVNRIVHIISYTQHPIVFFFCIFYLIPSTLEVLNLFHVIILIISIVYDLPHNLYTHQHCWSKSPHVTFNSVCHPSIFGFPLLLFTQSFHIVQEQVA